MHPTPCRVHTTPSGPSSDSPGTLAITPGDAPDSYHVTITHPDNAVTAALSRDEALAFLLAASDALGLVLFDPRDAARRTAAARGRRR